MQVHASVFKAYDIRGIVDQTIDEPFALHLGRAFGSEALAAGERAVAVGRDGRHSGPGPGRGAEPRPGVDRDRRRRHRRGDDADALLRGGDARAHGCNSGVQVTGSHNPKDYNGFKMVLAGRAIYGEDIQRLRQRIEAEDYAEGRGRQGAMDILAEYTARIVGDCSLKRPMRIVVDCGSGIAGASAPGVLRALGCSVEELYSEVDGDFPHTIPTRARRRTSPTCSPRLPPAGPSSVSPSTATATGSASSPRTARSSIPTGS